MKKKLLAIFLVLAVVAYFIPMCAFADDAVISLKFNLKKVSATEYMVKTTETLPSNQQFRYKVVAFDTAEEAYAAAEAMKKDVLGKTSYYIDLTEYSDAATVVKNGTTLSLSSIPGLIENKYNIVAIAKVSNVSVKDDGQSAFLYKYGVAVQYVGKQVSKINLETKAPVIGDKIPESVKVTEATKNGLTEITSVWEVSKNGKKWTIAKGTFTAGKYYRLKVTAVSADENQAFAVGDVISTVGNEPDEPDEPIAHGAGTEVEKTTEYKYDGEVKVKGSKSVSSTVVRVTTTENKETGETEKVEELDLYANYGQLTAEAEPVAEGKAEDSDIASDSGDDETVTAEKETSVSEEAAVSEETATDASPVTGDSTNIQLYYSLLILSLLGGAYVLKRSII